MPELGGFPHNKKTSYNASPTWVIFTQVGWKLCKKEAVIVFNFILKL